MRILSLAMNNIRTNKSATASLFLLILIAALLLNIGLTILTKNHAFFDDKVAELGDAHVTVITSSSEHSREYIEYLQNDSRVHNIDIQHVMVLEGSKFRYGDADMSIHTLLVNADSDHRISPLHLVEKLESTTDRDIYMSYSFKAGADYKLGDTFTMTHHDRSYSFRVAGFFETTVLGIHNMGLLKFYLPHDTYHSLAHALGKQEEAIQISTVLEDISQTGSLRNDFEKRFSSEPAEGGSPYYLRDAEIAKVTGTITMNIVAMIIVAFAAVMVMVSIIVIVFRVTNSIEDGMVNIGVLQAAGYTSWQIVSSIVAQFILISLSAGVVGVALSYLALPLFGGMMASLSGLMWSVSFEPAVNLMSILIVALLVFAVAGSMALKVRKLPPVIALRGGIQTHSFRKNLIPLATSKGGLHFLLACKTMLAHVKQNITIAVIMASVTFASIFSIVLYYNIAADKTGFLHLVGSETSDVLVVAKRDADAYTLFAGIENMEGVRKVALLDFTTLKIDGKAFHTNVSDDFGKWENNLIYKGRHPKYDNEIAISWLISKQLGKNIGDTVEVTAGGSSRFYLVTGLGQSLNNMGLEANITVDALQQLVPEYTGRMFNVYLEGIDNNRFMEIMNVHYGDSIVEMIDVVETIESQTKIYMTVVLVIMAVILTITMLVVTLILYLVIKTMILKRKKEFGILSANGFTSFQLMTQIAWSFVPVVTIGVVIGCMLGYLFTNSLLSLLLSSAGIKNVQFTVDFFLTVLLSGGIIVLAYIVSMLVARRIKRISAYELIVE